MKIHTNVCEGCHNEFKVPCCHKTQKYCRHKCWARAQHAPEKFKKRFESKVIRNGPDECWGWTATRSNFGYGICGYADKRLSSAHRISWELYRGPIPEGMFVLHRCDNPPCSNPKHLFLGTQDDNCKDMARKGRWNNQFTGWTECHNGHEYNPVNTLFVAGKRHCRVCRKETQRKYMIRLKEKTNAR